MEGYTQCVYEQDSQNAASLEPLWGSHFGYRDADERKASADIIQKLSLVIGGGEASLRLSADEWLKPKCLFGALRSSASRYLPFSPENMEGSYILYTTKNNGNNQVYAIKEGAKWENMK